MRKIVLAVTLVALAGPGLAAGRKEAGSPAEDLDPMANWVPPKVQNEQANKKEILALFKAMESAEKKGDLSAAAALVDFPVLMVTDDAEGQALSGSWDREKWTKVMEPFYKHPMQGVKVTRKPAIFMLSDSLASVDDQVTMTHGDRTIRARNSTLLVRKDGKWLVKAMVEGGWGAVMKESSAAASGEASPQTGTESAGSSTGTESSTGTGSSMGTGAGSAPSTAPEDQPQPQAPPSTTK